MRLSNGPQLRKLAYKIIHSTTVVLPAWKSILEDLKMAITLMPRDVATRWNSTYDMLEYALTHRKAVDAVALKRELGLRKFELADHEWEIVAQLHSVLKVSHPKRTRAANKLEQTTHSRSRSSRRLRYFFHVQLQILPQSFPRWTISRANFGPIHATRSTARQSVHPWH